MNEATLKSKLVDSLREELCVSGFVIIRHEDRFTHGIPDISITGNKRTSWLEVKYAYPKFSVKGIQELTASRLALAGFAYFVVFYEKDIEKRTFIVEPRHIGNFKNNLTGLLVCDGFDYKEIAKFIKHTHLH